MLETLSLLPRDRRRPVLGAYASMARNNAYLTIMDIMDQLHIEQPVLLDKKQNPLDLEANIRLLALFDRPLPPETEIRAVRLLMTHFPFLKVVADSAKGGSSSFQFISQSFLNAMNVLTHLRDGNLHSRLVEDPGHPAYYHLRNAEHYFGFTLKDILTAAPRMLKERYASNGLLNEKSFDFFLNGRNDPRTHRFNKQWQFNPQQDPAEEERRVYRDGTLVTDRDGRAKTFLRISPFGEILTIALFVEKGYHHFLLRDTGLLSGFRESSKDGTLSEQRILREIVSAYSIRLPERKLDTEADVTQVRLDMLNELRRCPSELFDVLPPGERRKFEISSSDGSPVLMKRYSDRYVPMMLRYFDTSRAFSRLRFQVNSGKVRQVLHGPVPYMDGEPRTRIIQQDLNGFGRIQDIETARTSEERRFGLPLLRPDREGTGPELPGITDSAARYVLNGNLIGISLRGDIEPQVSLPDGTGRIRVSCPEPDCWLSRFDLPGLSFYHYLHDKYGDGPSVEDIVDSKTREYREFFQGVADGRITTLDDVSIPERDIPEKLIAYLRGGKDGSDPARYRRDLVDRLIRNGQERLDRIHEDLKAVDSPDNRVGKRSFVRILPGRLASWLAEDIVYFQAYPAGQPGRKLTGQQYSILQGMIAAFSPGLEEACRRAGLLEGESSHPFLAQVFRRHADELKDTVSFYIAYLEERESYLKGDIPADAPFFHSGRAKWTEDKDAAYYRALALRYVRDPETGRDKAVFLPGRLFEQPIKSLLEHHCPAATAKIREAVSKTARANSAFMILTYLEEDLDDGCQDYYFVDERLDGYGFAATVRKEIERNGYRNLESIIQREPRGLYRNNLTELVDECRRKGLRRSAMRPRSPHRNGLPPLDERLRNGYRAMTENEKAIRRYMVQDITMFLLARREVDSSEKLKLLAVTPDGSGILEQKVNVTTRAKVAGRTYLISQQDVKVKDQGEIHRTLKDKRIESLLKNAAAGRSSAIPLSEIEEELTSYDNRRVDVISTFLSYEDNVWGRESRTLERVEFPGFKDVLNADGSISGLEKESLRRIRNAFSHNSYPERVVTVKDGGQASLYRSDMPEIAEEIARNADLIVNGKGKD